MAIELAENRPAEVQEMFDSSGATILPQNATFSVPFEVVRKIVESAPSPRRPSRCRPVHGDFAEEMEAWEEASDEALEIVDREFPPLEN